MRAVDDADSLDDVFRRDYERLVRLAHVLTRSNAVAEDVVQAAFIGLHQRWDDVERPSAYLRTAVVNGCTSWHRSRAREAARFALVHDDTPVSLGAREMLDALAALPTAQQTALALRFYEGLSEAEIADVMACPVGTVKSHLHRGLRRLRKVIEP